MYGWLVVVACVATAANRAPAAGLYFTPNGNDLSITAREADGTQYWQLNITGAVATPASGSVGAINQFYDLTGDAGSNPTTNLATSSMFYTSITRSGSSGVSLPSVGAISAPAVESLVDGAGSYSFTLTHTWSDYDANSDGSATFTSVVTIHAPTDEGTRFTVENTMVTDENWLAGSTLANGGRDSRSRLVLSVQAVQDASLENYNGWTSNPKDTNQWALTTAGPTSTDYADGRTFLLSQTTLGFDTPGTAGAYAGVSQTISGSSLEQQLSGAYRGNAPADWTGQSVGFLEINIAAVPDPSTAGLLLGLAASALGRRRRSGVGR